MVTAFHESALSLPDSETEKTLTHLVKRCFTLVASTWTTAWGLRPTESRLMHGVGLRAMAALLVSKLEALSPNFDGDYSTESLWSSIETSLRRLQPHLVWRLADTAHATKSAEKLYREEIAARQNTTQDITALTTAIKRLSLDLDTEAAKAKRRK